MYQIESCYPYFPNLHRARKDSDADSTYNCIAWAADDNTQPWDPYLYYWPEGARRDYSLQACIEAFEQIGYVICDSPEIEDGFEKVAIWSLNNEYEHAAKQLDNGEWTSKVGKCEDIIHDLDDLYSEDQVNGYGNIACYMKRPRQAD